MEVIASGNARYTRVTLQGPSSALTPITGPALSGACAVRLPRAHADANLVAACCALVRGHCLHKCSRTA
eukprot:358372-Chlamydomonas_euryale.AAC.4